MNYTRIKVIIVSLLVVFLYACNDDSKQQKSIKPTEVTNNLKTPTAKTAEPAQNEKGVWHYTCALGCPGGSGSATKCKNCSNTLAHNPAYHGNTTNTQNSSPLVSPSTTQAAEPSQNAAGVWHYTCENGCAGGAGSAVNCATCGTTLAHNSAYH